MRSGRPSQLAAACLLASAALNGCEMSGVRPAAVKTTTTTAEKPAPPKSATVAGAKDDVPLKPPTIELVTAKNCPEPAPMIVPAVRQTIGEPHETVGVVIDTPLQAPAPPPAPEAPAPRQLPAG